MEQQWKNIKLASTKIINNAFEKQEDRENAKNVVSRLAGSFVDMFLMGDSDLFKAIDALGISKYSNFSRPFSPSSPSSPSSRTSTSNVQTTPPGLNHASQPQRNTMSAAFEFIAPTNQMNSDDLRQMFPFLSSIIDVDRNGSNVQTNQSTDQSTPRNETTENTQE